MSTLVHFWAKSFKTFHEILCSRTFPCLILPYNRSRSIQGHHLNYLVSTLVPDATCTCKVSRPLVNWFWRRSFKGFYHIWAWWLYWSCDLDSLNMFLFWRLHMKYGYNRLIGFWGNVWICKIMVVPRSKVKQWPWPFLPQIFIYLLRQPYLPFYAKIFKTFHEILCISIFPYLTLS